MGYWALCKNSGFATVSTVNLSTFKSIMSRDTSSYTLHYMCSVYIDVNLMDKFIYTIYFVYISNTLHFGIKLKHHIVCCNNFLDFI